MAASFVGQTAAHTANALDLLLPEPRVRHAGPSTLLVTLSEQLAHNRQVLHLLHYIPERRGSSQRFRFHLSWPNFSAEHVYGGDSHLSVFRDWI